MSEVRRCWLSPAPRATGLATTTFTWRCFWAVHLCLAGAAIEAEAQPGIAAFALNANARAMIEWARCDNMAMTPWSHPYTPFRSPGLRNWAGALAKIWQGSADVRQFRP